MLNGADPLNNTWIDLIEQRAELQADRTAFSFFVDDETTARTMSHRTLANRAKAIAAGLQESGITPNQRVLVSTEAGLEFFVAFFGCLLAGIIAVPTFPPKPRRRDVRLEAIVAGCQPAAILTTDTCAKLFQKQHRHVAALAQLPMHCTREFDLSLIDNWHRPSISADQTAFLQYTSGSTSSPKGVQLSHQNTFHNCRAMAWAFGTDCDTKGISWVPPFHDMGLVGGILHPLFTGFPIAHLPWLSIIDKPIRWLRAIDRYGATISAGPNFIHEYCAERIGESQKKGLDLSRWRVAVCGAEPVRSATLQRFYRAFRDYGFKKQTFYPCYGMAESTLFVSGGQGRTTATQRLVEPVVSCGTGPQNQSIKIVNPDTLAEQPETKEGEIWLSGPSVAQGYWNREFTSEIVFGARLNGSAEPRYLKTGDLGYLKNGELYVTGRIKDLIVYRGRNIYPQDLEAAVETAHPALRPNGGAAFSLPADTQEDIVIVQELKLGFKSVDPQEVFDEILKTIDGEFHVVPRAILLTKPGSTPKTSSGKVQRALCKHRYQTEQLPMVFKWDQSETLSAVSLER